MDTIDKQGYVKRVGRALERHPDMFDGLDLKGYEHFMRWLRLNHHIVQAYHKKALYLREHGKRKRYSVYTIRENLRWESHFQEVNSAYKISNNVTPFIARLIMKITPDLDGMFNTKKVAGKLSL